MNDYIDLVLCKFTSGYMSGCITIFRAPFASGIKEGEYVLVSSSTGDSSIPNTAKVLAKLSCKIGGDEYNFALKTLNITDTEKVLYSTTQLEYKEG